MLYEVITKAILATLKRLLGKGLVNPDDIVAIASSTQWAGTVAVDREGNPLMNAIIWMDMRLPEPGFHEDGVDRLLRILLRFEHRFKDRITSYNVCYTKLLRAQDQ